jgi:hypothetical protein
MLFPAPQKKRGRPFPSSPRDDWLKKSSLIFAQFCLRVNRQNEAGEK